MFLNKISVLSGAYSSNEFLKCKTLSLFPNTKFIASKDEINNKEKLVNFIGESEGVIVGLERMDFDLLSKCKNVKYIAKYGVGLNNIIQEDLNKLNIKLGWTGGVNRHSVAEITLGYILSLCRNISLNTTLLRQDKWIKNGGRSLRELTVGVIGVGYIGKELVRLLEPFGCKILLNDILEDEKFSSDFGLEFVSKEEIYVKSDIITYHVPLTRDTKDMVDSNTISQMKQSPFLVNTARGPIFNINSVKNALKN
ncbi:MAG: hypothetical protein NXH75_18065, partial [Halobacteriovoraceae bacterium]|nr:hypothetical protein [Halobacteriovoraceae bacterium]